MHAMSGRQTFLSSICIYRIVASRSTSEDGGKPAKGPGGVSSVPLADVTTEL